MTLEHPYIFKGWGAHPLVEAAPTLYPDFLELGLPGHLGRRISLCYPLSISVPQPGGFSLKPGSEAHLLQAWAGACLF